MDELEIAARKICIARGMQFVKADAEGTFKRTFQVVASDGNPLALKLYKASGTSGREQREIQAMLRCQHGSIAKLLSVRTYSHRKQRILAVTEEYLPGGTLSSKGRITAADAIVTGCPLIDALVHIAGLGLVHRDIKPENVMFRSDQTPVLTDFGIVRDLSESSITPTFALRGPGTPFFSAPEQLKNEKRLIDWRTDQFSLGVTIAYMAMGEHPYKTAGAEDWDVVERVSSRQEPSQKFKDQAVKLGLPVLIRMTAPWPVNRFRKPQELRKAWSEQKG